jgi:hypothetical protein
MLKEKCREKCRIGKSKKTYRVLRLRRIKESNEGRHDIRGTGITAVMRVFRRQTSFKVLKSAKKPDVVTSDKNFVYGS